MGDALLVAAHELVAEPRVDARTVVLDCDPGHDDVIAIVVAAAHTQLMGVTTVAGNAPLDRTTYNACVMRDPLDLGCPVHSGADRPLVAPPRLAAFVHGVSGLDGADLPAPPAGPRPTPGSSRGSSTSPQPT